jgi:hypothetical protein
MPANFSSLSIGTNPKSYKGGYKDVVYFCPLPDFATIAKPLDVALALGDQVKVDGDHTFAGTNGFFNWECKQDSVKITSSPVGDAGSRLARYKAEFTLIGDSAATQEQMERLMNTKGLFLLKESACLVDDSYAQMGDECDTPVVSWEFDSGTKEVGTKIYKVTIEVTAAKYFYTGAVVESTA